MRIPTKYSDLRPKERGMLGYVVTTGTLCIIGYFYQPVLILAMYLSISISIGAGILPYISPYYLSFSVGSSMLPAIPVGLTLSLSSNRINNLKVGDVVSYKTDRKDKNVHHRIIEINKNEYILKGDGNDRKDPHPVTKDQIEYKSIQYGYQPIYITISPLAILTTLIKLYKKLQGEHHSTMKEYINIE